MKRFLIVFCTLFIFSYSFGQRIDNYKDIIGIDKINSILDFGLIPNLATLDSPIRIDQITFEEKIDGISEKKLKSKQELFFKFKDELLTESGTKFTLMGKDNPWYIKKHQYDDKNRVILIEDFQLNNTKILQTVKYTYSQKHKHIPFKKSVINEFGKENITLYEPLDENWIKESSDKNKFYKKHFLVMLSKIRWTESYSKIDDKLLNKTSYKYFSNSFITETANSTIEFLLDSKMNITNKKEINNNETKETHYYYKYDKYSNWIIFYEYPFNKKITDYRTTDIKLRQITYSNGEKTGSTDFNNEEVKKHLKEIRYKVFVNNREKNFTTNTWKKNKDNAFWITYKGEQIAKKCKVGGMGKSYIAFYPVTKELFLLANFSDKDVDTNYPLEKLEIDLTNGYWYKNANGSVAVFKNDGTYIEKSSVYKYATNQIDIIYKGENETNQVVLENYKNAETYKVYPVKLETNTTFNVVESYKNKNTINNISSIDKATFKKLNNGENFHFLIDNIRVGNDCKNGYMNNDLLIYYPLKKQLYICRDFKNKEDNTEYTAEKANINTEFGFWFKTKNGGVHVYDEKGVYIKKSSIYKFATNKIDVIYRGQFEQKTLLLEHFKDAIPYKLLPVKLHEDTYKTEKLINTYATFNYKETTNSNGDKIKGFFNDNTPNGPISITNSNNETEFFNSTGSYTNTKSAFFKQLNNDNTQFIDTKNNLTLSYNINESKLEFIENNQTKTLPFINTIGCLTEKYGCRNGIGAYKYDNDAIYIGNFTNDKRNGFGKLSFKSGQAYIGEFENNNKNGIGSYIYGNGDIYIGEWKDDELHGLGTYYFKNSTIQAGIWDQGTFVKSLEKEKINSVVTNNTNKKNSNSNNSNSNNIKTNTAKKVIRNTIEGLTVFPESGSLKTLTAELADINEIEYKLGNSASYNGTPEGVAIVSSCSEDRKVVFVKASRDENRTQGNYDVSWSHTEYYVSILNGKNQHEKVMNLGRDSYITKRHKTDSRDVKSGYLNIALSFSWSMSGDLFTIKSNRGKSYKVNMSKCLKL